MALKPTIKLPNNENCLSYTNEIEFWLIGNYPIELIT